MDQPKLQSNIPLEKGEEVVFELKVSFLRKWWEFFLGIKKNGYLVITNKRVAEVYDKFCCCCCSTERVVKYVMPRSVAEVGYKRYGFCCRRTFIYYQALTQETAFEVDNQDTAIAIVNAFYNAINAAAE